MHAAQLRDGRPSQSGSQPVWPVLHEQRGLPPFWLAPGLAALLWIGMSCEHGEATLPFPVLVHVYPAS